MADLELAQDNRERIIRLEETVRNLAPQLDVNRRFNELERLHDATSNSLKVLTLQVTELAHANKEFNKSITEKLEFVLTTQDRAIKQRMENENKLAEEQVKELKEKPRKQILFWIAIIGAIGTVISILLGINHIFNSYLHYALK